MRTFAAREAAEGVRGVGIICKVCNGYRWTITHKIKMVKSVMAGPAACRAPVRSSDLPILCGLLRMNDHG